jgi:hypothetical protein
MMSKPSQILIAAAENQRAFNYTQECAVVEAWETALTSNAISAGSFTLHRDGQSVVNQGNLMEIHMCLDPFANSHDHLMLAAAFRKGDTAYIDDWFFSDERKEKEPALCERYAEFLGFEGTWEEVGLKIIELNDFVVLENTPPPMPDLLRE